jgi:histone acetyltransferase (RNA polymerase elongator complex component)
MSSSPLVIPIFIPHSGCPHQCAFCNQSTITKADKALPCPDRVGAIIRRYLGFTGTRSRVEAAFFGGNFLGLAPGQITCLMESVKPFLDSGAVQGIRFSTRPDTVTRDRLDLVRSYPVCLVELGVQSMDDQVLDRVNRGHTSEDTFQAMALLRDRGLGVGVQVMAGLPGDTREGMIRTANILAGLLPLTARIYPVLVLENTLLARWYKHGKYHPLDLDQAVDLTGRVYRIFTRAGVRVIRMGLQASGVDTGGILAGPWHPALGHLVFSRIMFQNVLKMIQTLEDGQTPGNIILLVHPFSESRLRGDKNSNMHRLKAAFPRFDFAVVQDPAMAPDQVDLFRSPA